MSDPIIRKVAQDTGKTEAEIESLYKSSLYTRFLHWWALWMNSMAGSKRWK